MMDGSLRITLASQNLQWPNGLTVDYVSDHIYWTDAKFHTIERIDLDGGGRKTIVSRGELDQKELDRKLVGLEVK